VSEETAATEPEPRSSGVSRVLVIVAATLVVLLVGAAGGMLITLNRVEENPFPSADSVDVGFAQDMRVHHLQAVTMAGIARDKTTDKDIQGLAFDIESTQLGQLSAMGGWLTVWGQPELLPPGTPYMRWMSGAGGGGGHQHGGGPDGVTTMPGMASSAELNELRSASGKQLDVLFLQLMLRHHQGGYAMAEYAAKHASVGYVRNMAQKIMESQSAESRLMEAFLTERGGTPLPLK
jgi:uncharacterized protein (DUF305 family)